MNYECHVKVFRGDNGDVFFQIPTTTLELHDGIDINTHCKNIAEVRDTFGMLMDEVQNYLINWRQLTKTEVMLIKELN